MGLMDPILPLAWAHKGLKGSIYEHISKYGSICSHIGTIIGPLGFLLSLMGPLMGPSGSRPGPLLGSHISSWQFLTPLRSILMEA